MAGAADRRTGDLHRNGRAPHRIVEWNCHRRFEVRTLPRLGSASISRPGAEQPAEQISQVPGVDALPSSAPRPALGSPILTTEPCKAGRTRVAHPVVRRALLLVPDHVVRRGDLLEPLLRVLVPTVCVGMETLRELPIRLLDFSG